MFPLRFTEGLLKSKSFVKVWDKIRRVNHTKVTDSAGVTRQVYVRYVKEYPVESNDWGDFQTHRRLLGLITVGTSQLILHALSSSLFTFHQLICILQVNMSLKLI